MHKGTMNIKKEKKKKLVLAAYKFELGQHNVNISNRRIHSILWNYVPLIFKTVEF